MKIKNTFVEVLRLVWQSIWSFLDNSDLSLKAELPQTIQTAYSSRVISSQY